eukprot:scaffold51372_cov15-Tisochrysis_lutea.AAC.1
MYLWPQSGVLLAPAPPGLERVESCWPLLRILGLGGYAHALDIASASSISGTTLTAGEHASQPALPAAPHTPGMTEGGKGLPAQGTAGGGHGGHGGGGGDGAEAIVAGQQSHQQQHQQQQQGHDQQQEQQQLEGASEGACRAGVGRECDGAAVAVQLREQLAVGCGDKTVRVMCGAWEMQRQQAASSGSGGGGGGG